MVFSFSPMSWWRVTSRINGFISLVNNKFHIQCEFTGTEGLLHFTKLQVFVRLLFLGAQSDEFGTILYI